MNIRIEQIEYYLPGKPVGNDYIQSLFPGWDLASIAEKTGVYERHFSEKGETGFDFARKACDRLFESGVVKKEEIDGIIFCTQAPDYIMPTNAFLLHEYLKLRQNIFAFDYNLGCSGFVLGLAIARGFIATKMAKKILFINSEAFTKFVHPRDRASMALFGDGGAVSLIVASDEPGIIDCTFDCQGQYDAVNIPAGGHRRPKSAETAIEITDQSGNVRTAENFYQNGFAVWKFIGSTVPKQILEILAKNHLKVEDIDLFVFHQASKMTLDSLAKTLKIAPHQTYSNISKTGNLSSASIPIALKDAEHAGKLKRGQTVVLSGFGVGLSWGTVILKY